MANKELRLGTIFEGRVDKSFISATAKLRTIVTDLNKAMGGATTSANKAATAQSNVAKSHDKAATATKKHTTQSVFLNKQIRKIHGVYGQLMGAMKVTASYGIAGSAVYAFVTALKSGVNEIIVFDQALKNLQAITGATDSQVSLMGETIKDVARTTKFSTGEVAEGMTLLGQAGFTASESISAMQATANLATGTLSNMVTTTDLMTTTIRAFGLNALEAGRVSDVMANAINKSKLTIDKLKIAFNFVGAAAAQSGVKLEETAASMMLLANNGLRASTIGTGLRQVMARLLAPNKKLRQAFEEHSIALDKVNPSLVGWSAALKNLTPVLYNHEKGLVDMGKAYQLFGLRGAQASAILIKGFMSGRYQEMLDKTYETGTASNMAAKQAEGLGIKFKNLADRAKLIAVALGEIGLAGALHTVVDALRSTTEWMENFAQSVEGKVLIQLTLLVASLNLVKVAIMALGAAIIPSWVVASVVQFGLLKGAFLALSAAGAKLLGILAAMTGPIGASIAAISAFTLLAYRAATAERRMAEDSMKLATEFIKTADAMKTFGDILESLKDSPKEYEATVQRLMKEHPELARSIYEVTGAVDISTLSHKDLVEAMNKVSGEKRADALNKYTISIKYNYEQMKKSAEALEEMHMKYLQGKISLKEYTEAASKAARETGVYKGNIKDMVDMMSVQIATNQHSAMWFERWIDILAKSSPVMKSVAKELREGLTKELERVGKAANASKSVHEKFTAELPKNYQQFYEDLDLLRQADFAKVLETVEKEKAEYGKRAKVLGHSVEQQMEAKAAMESRAFAEFRANLKKEFETVAENQRRIIETYQKTADAATATLAGESEKIKVEYEKRVIIAKESGENLIEVDAWAKAQMEEANRKHTSEINAQTKNANKVYLDSLKVLYEEAVDLAEDSVKELSSRLKGLEKELKTVLDKMASEEDSYKDKVRDIKQKLMTDEEKWLDDRKEANRLWTEAIKTGDDELFKKSKDMFLSLTRVVKDEQGKVVKTLEETTKFGLGSAAMVHFQHMKNMKGQATELQSEIKTVKDALVVFKGQVDEFNKSLKALAKDSKITLSIDEVIRNLETVQKHVDELKKDVTGEDSALRLSIRTLEGVEALEELKSPLDDIKHRIDIIGGKPVIVLFEGIGSTKKGLVDKLVEIKGKAVELLDIFTAIAKEWTSTLTINVRGIAELKNAWNLYDKFKNKTVTITVVTKSTSGGGGSVEDSGGTDGDYDTDYGGAGNRLGGLIKMLAGGGKLAGFGGGDKIRALLEPGEFVMRKEAVSKYGEGVFHALNSLAFRFGGIVDNMSARFKGGGIIPSLPSANFAFASSSPPSATSGAPAPSIGGGGGGNNYNFYYSPMVSTASRSEMRKAAGMFNKFIQENQRRRG